MPAPTISVGVGVVGIDVRVGVVVTVTLGEGVKVAVFVEGNVGVSIVVWDGAGVGEAIASGIPLEQPVRMIQHKKTEKKEHRSVGIVLPARMAWQSISFLLFQQDVFT